MELTFSIVLLSVNEVVINGNQIAFKIAIHPSKPQDLAYTPTGSQKHRKHRQPMFVSPAFRNIVNKCGLLRNGQRMTLPLLPIMALLDFCHDTVGRICTDQTIPNCHRKNGMQDRMDNFHAVGFETQILDQMDIESLDITVFDRRDAPQANVFGYIFFVHILVVCPGGLLQLILRLNIGIKETI